MLRTQATEQQGPVFIPPLLNAAAHYGSSIRKRKIRLALALFASAVQQKACLLYCRKRLSGRPALPPPCDGAFSAAPQEKRLGGALGAFQPLAIWAR
jgi:hypothetical protein